MAGAAVKGAHVRSWDLIDGGRGSGSGGGGGDGGGGVVGGERAGSFTALRGITYLDHAGAAPYSDEQLQCVFERLRDSCFGNPHSENASSARSSALVEQTRERLLRFADADATVYECVFTAGASAALRMLAHEFPWTANKSWFIYTEDNHNSVVGMRESARRHGATVHCVADVAEFLSVAAELAAAATPSSAQHMFALPAESNFNGRRYDLDWIAAFERSASNRNMHIVVDSAALASHGELRVSAIGGAAYVLSLYKLMGYPTGIGALIVRRSLLRLCADRDYFGGGTVLRINSAPSSFFVQLKDGAARFEDGTLPFQQAAVGVGVGLDILEHIGMRTIDAHCQRLVQQLLASMRALQHANGARVCVVYCDPNLDTARQGPIIAFNVLDSAGEYIGYSDVVRAASLNDIHLRGGCFCNPGACRLALGHSGDDIERHLNEVGKACGDDNDLIDGVPTGAVRVSLGYTTSARDVGRFVEFLRRTYVDDAEGRCAASATTTNGAAASHVPVHTLPATAVLASVWIYPVKSCAGMRVSGEWPVSASGLLHDREWAIVDAQFRNITQKMMPKLGRVMCRVDRLASRLYLSFDGSEYSVSLDAATASVDAAGGGIVKDVGSPVSLQPMRICNDNRDATMCEAGVSAWLASVLGVRCYLVRSRRSARAFSNQAPFLAVNMASVRDVQSRLGRVIPDLHGKFRANFVVEFREGGGAAYVEDRWTAITMGGVNGNGVRFESVGGCNRCKMICIDPDTETVSNEPLRTLYTYRKVKASVLFGCLMRLDSPAAAVRAGDSIAIEYAAE